MLAGWYFGIRDLSVEEEGCHSTQHDGNIIVKSLVNRYFL